MTAATHQKPISPNSTQPQRVRLTGKDVGIPVRKLGQVYDSELPTYWVGGNSFLTLFFSAMSATLPEGEDQFIYSIRLFQDRINDPVLRAQVRAFIGQEGHHSREHDLINQEMIHRGFPLDRIENGLRKLNQKIRKTQSHDQQLATTVAAEHLTALLADLALNKYPPLLAMTHEIARNLWGWHSIEETEHKAVAFDVYQQLVGNKRLLNRSLVIVTTAFIFGTSYQALRMLPAKEWLNFRMWREAWNVMSSMICVARKDFMDFFKEDFHPWQHDNRDCIEAAKLIYLGE